MTGDTAVSLINEQRLLERFMRLVRIDSESGGEREICNVLTKELADLGLTVEEDQSHLQTGLGSGNIYARLSAVDQTTESSALPILLSCHMDTVQPGRRVQPQIDEDGYIRSDGTTILGSDDKAGVCAVLEALSVLRERRFAHGSVEVLISAGEEVGLLGIRHFDGKRLTAKCGYVLDASGPVGKVYLAESGKATLTITATGKAGHASMPEQGVNAIAALCKALASHPFGRRDGDTTSNLGSISGGTALNIIAEQATAELEVRSLDERKLIDELSSIKAAVERSLNRDGTTASFDEQRTCDSYQLDAGQPTVRLAQQAIQRLGRTMITGDNMGNSDANLLNRFGIPTAKLSIGYEHIHSRDERIAVSELVKATELALFLILEAVGFNSSV
jgi:tripeptide aminopeptidase